MNYTDIIKVINEKNVEEQNYLYKSSDIFERFNVVFIKGEIVGWIYPDKNEFECSKYYNNSAITEEFMVSCSNLGLRVRNI